MNWALVVACLALVFTVASFWWLQARRGSLEVGQPGAYTFATRVRLKLPLAIYNAGARALVVTDLLVLVDDGDVRLPWIATTDRLYGDEGRDFQTAFAVPGRSTYELNAEFGHDDGWSPEPGLKHRMRLLARLHDRGDKWHDVAEFDWWAPPPGAKTGAYIAYRNAPPDQQYGRNIADA